ncbi:DUF4132 domain-containing protein [Yinghuangia seranimata]|uniref:DUF4132 domain-containing protein n=1 Tax=Yinghuangia seranimata TaxID=408067 RepID=UPI00248B8A3A|nr:DUF4132 domain-containing protein [Yinghuangia seranimata]MDI2126482.1 DUF4132 domain-containing protein [Yinghuangia seranimata]
MRVVTAAEAAERSDGRRDEDVLVVPETWRKLVHPRRGRVFVTPEPPAPNALRSLRRQVETAVEGLASVHPRVEPDAVEAARRYAAGEPDPVGAAAWLTLGVSSHTRPETIVDAWVEEHGLPFAAAAGVEAGAFRDHGVWHSTLDGITRRLRELLADCEESTYRAAADTVAEHREGTLRRVVASYVMPDMAEWATECVALDGAALRDAGELRYLLILAATRPEQLAWLRGSDLGEYFDDQWRTDVLTTLVVNVGPGWEWLIEDALEGRPFEASGYLLLLEMLSHIPSDKAFRLLGGRIGYSRARPLILAAANRYPARAMTWTASALERNGDNEEDASLRRRFLVAHAAAHPGIAAELRDRLPAVAQELLVPHLADAPADALPGLLATPPWAVKRKRSGPAAVPGLTPAPIRRVVWQDGEREPALKVVFWSKVPANESNLAALRAGRLKHYEAVALFVQNPDADLADDLRTWRSDDHWPALRDYAALLATWEEPAIDAVLALVARTGMHNAELVMPVVDITSARLVAGWLHRRRDARDVALRWLGRHAEDALRLLIPDAFGRNLPLRRAAEAVVLAVAAADSMGGAEAVRRAAAEFGPAAAAGIEALLTADPLYDTLPSRLPALPAWADPAGLPQLVLRSGAGAVPDAEVRHLLTMLAMCKPDAPYAGVARVKAELTPDSAAEFAWALFEAWRMAGMPAKEVWAFSALGWLGDDRTAARLAPIVREWPYEGLHRRAADGLDVIAAIGTSGALRELQAIALRAKARALRTHAQGALAKVADTLGLNADEFAERLVQDFGLADPTALVFDYGARRFTAGFADDLTLYVVDEHGKHKKALPAPGVRDDETRAAAERKRFTALKKAVRTAVSDALPRLEHAMIHERTWSAADFRELYVDHPLLGRLGRRLVWSADVDGVATAFRIAEDRTFADAADTAFNLPDHAVVSIPHPVALTDDELASWREVFEDYEISQPVAQLGRPVGRLAPEDHAANRVARFEGVELHAAKLLGLERRGWQREAPGQGGRQFASALDVGDGWSVEVWYEPGIYAGSPLMRPDQKIDGVVLRDTGPTGARERTFGDLRPALRSEIAVALDELTSAD